VNNSTIGDGVRNYGSGTMMFNESTISGDVVWNLSAGSVTLNNCTVLTGIDNSGNGSVALNTCTVMGSTGPGIFNDRSATAILTNSTVSRNFGTGIYNIGTLHARNSIIAGNTGDTGDPSDLFGDLGSQGYNLIGNAQGGFGFDPTDLLNVDPLLGPLQDNGGPTQTMALLAGSRALNAGEPNELGNTDQRGVVRAGGVNIGAYQASACAFVLTAPATIRAGAPLDVTVKAVDPFGQTALGYTGTAHFTSSDGQAVLPGDYTFASGDAGMHTFSGGVTLKTAGSQSVTATDTGTGSITGGATVLVNPAAADHLLFFQQPTDTVAGQTIMPAVMVAVVDQFGNVVTSDNSDTVTLSIGTNPSGGTLSGTLALTVVNGIATFSDLSIDLAGDGYTLRAMTTGLTDADSAAFSITA
jgi:hypothetical protein